MRFEGGLPDDSVNVSEGSVTREALILVSGVAISVLLLSLTLALAIEAIVPWIPASLEVRLFSAVAAHFESERDEGDTIDPRGESVQAILDRLAAHWSKSPYSSLRVHVSEEPTPNAYALPGGLLVVTSGLLDRIETENELAFVLGHELGHFAGRDHLRGLGRGLALSLAWTALGLGGDQIEHLSSLASALSTRHFDRTQESDADRFGLELIVAEYGHAAGTAAVFERVLRDQEDDSTARGPDRMDQLSATLSTHPLGPNRIAALEAARAMADYPATGIQIPWTSNAPTGIERAESESDR